MLWIILVALVLIVIFHRHGWHLVKWTLALLVAGMVALLIVSAVLGSGSQAQEAIENGALSKLPEGTILTVGKPQLPAGRPSYSDPYPQLHPMSAADVADRKERERLWIERCKPVIVKGHNGDPDRYRYAAEDCP